LLGAGVPADKHVEALMWSAIRALEQQAEYSSQMADEIDGAAGQSS
jgi:hypothetical protein